LQEPPERGVVEPGFVVVEGRLGDLRLADESVARPCPGTGYAVSVVTVDRVGGTGRIVGVGNDRALVVGMQPATACEARALIPDQRLVFVGP